MWPHFPIWAIVEYKKLNAPWYATKAYQQESLMSY